MDAERAARPESVSGERRGVDTTVADTGSSKRPAAILVVEDQDDVRRMLVTALQIEGHAVAEAACADDGLERLQSAHYDLVLSDYSMPGHTGTWMLNEAAREGLLERTAALIITAHPDIEDLPDVEVINKPVDLDVFLEQVRRIVESTAAAPSDDERRESAAASHRVELVLYVSPRSPASRQARQQLQAVLQAFEPLQVGLEVCDLARDPHAGETDRVAFTPTLVKRAPEPPVRILGDLRDPAIVIDLLRACGVDRLARSTSA